MATNDPRLAGKLKVRLDDSEGPVLWYIKFNIVLDPESVSSETTTVTETNGYILETDIAYDTERNLIVITPTDPYEEGVFYVLTISKKVRSAGGQQMGRDIHILFKIKNKKIEEYKMVPAGTKIAAARKKPEKLKAQTAARVYGFSPEQKKRIESVKAGTLPFDKMNINIALAVLSIPVTLIGVIGALTPVVYAGAALLLGGILHIIIQLRNKSRRSAFQYNAGVFLFNAGRYKAALKRFERAVELNPHNEMAEHAVNKSSFYN
ncbi:MAG: hypothetical protein LBS19_14260 [Clostridiales bacterium]|nr:hypothetical protein [Clostridiales bacterium]